jgi:hypothetical protein
MGSIAEIAWSELIEEGDWIRDRLATPVGSTVTSIIPAGFDAYARVLHPAVVAGDGLAGDQIASNQTPGDQTISDQEGRARWAQVAAWSGLELRSNAQFHSVALPPGGPVQTELEACRAPRKGSLAAGDCGAVAALLRPHTTTPDRCWFCLWEGYAWQGVKSNPIPADILEGPRVSLPRRGYVLFGGPVEAATAIDDAAFTPNIWWPADRAWCVVSAIDLLWTYVAGPAPMIAELMGHRELEVLPAQPDDRVSRVESWVVEWAYTAVDELFRGGSCRVETPRGSIEAWFERPGLQTGALGITSTTADGRRWSKRTTIEHRVDQELRRLVSLHLMMHLVDLVES